MEDTPEQTTLTKAHWKIWLYHLPIFLLLHWVPALRMAIFITEICDIELNMLKANNLLAKYELHLHLPLINLFLQWQPSV